MTNATAVYRGAQARKFLPVVPYNKRGISDFVAPHGQIVGTNVMLSSFMCVHERSVRIFGQHDEQNPMPHRIIGIAGRGCESAKDRVFKYVSFDGNHPAFINIRGLQEGGALYLGIKKGAMAAGSEVEISPADVLNRLDVQKGQWVLLPNETVFMVRDVDIDIVSRPDQELEALEDSQAILSRGGKEWSNVEMLMGNLPRKKQDPYLVVRTSLVSHGIVAEHLDFPRRGAVCTIDTNRRAGLLAVTSGEVMIRSRSSSYRHLLGGKGGIVFQGSRVIAHSLMPSSMLFVRL